MLNVILTMIVKNEERSLKRCLAAAKPYVDGMVIVDTGSTDLTKEIAQSFGADVTDFTWCDDFSLARNASIERAESKFDADFMLVLDADEYLREDEACNPERFRRFLDDAVQQNRNIAGLIRRNDAFPADDGISYSITTVTRLLPRGTRYEGSIHEQPVPPKNIPTRMTPLFVEHDGYLQGGKGERNLRLLLRALEKDPDNAYYQYQTAVTYRNMKELGKALPHFRQFYALSQFKDKKSPYFIEGTLLYLYTLTDVGGEGNLIEAFSVMEQVEKRYEESPDFYFFSGIYYMKLVLCNTQKYGGFLPMIERCYLKCLELGENNRTFGVVGTGSYRAYYNLGTWYEVSGQLPKAKECYQKAAASKYGPAIERLKLFTK